MKAKIEGRYNQTCLAILSRICLQTISFMHALAPEAKKHPKKSLFPSSLAIFGLLVSYFIGITSCSFSFEIEAFNNDQMPQVLRRCVMLSQATNKTYFIGVDKFSNMSIVDGSNVMLASVDVKLPIEYIQLHDIYCYQDIVLVVYSLFRYVAWDVIHSSSGSTFQQRYNGQMPVAASECFDWFQSSTGTLQLMRNNDHKIYILNIKDNTSQLRPGFDWVIADQIENYVHINDDWFIFGLSPTVDSWNGAFRPFIMLQSYTVANCYKMIQFGNSSRISVVQNLADHRHTYVSLREGLVLDLDLVASQDGSYTAWNSLLITTFTFTPAPMLHISKLNLLLIVFDYSNSDHRISFINTKTFTQVETDPLYIRKLLSDTSSDYYNLASMMKASEFWKGRFQFDAIGEDLLRKVYSVKLDACSISEFAVETDTLYYYRTYSECQGRRCPNNQCDIFATALALNNSAIKFTASENLHEIIFSDPKLTFHDKLKKEVHELTAANYSISISGAVITISLHLSGFYRGELHVEEKQTGDRPFRSKTLRSNLSLELIRSPILSNIEQSTSQGLRTAGQVLTAGSKAATAVGLASALALSSVSPSVGFLLFQHLSNYLYFVLLDGPILVSVSQGLKESMDFSLVDLGLQARLDKKLEDQTDPTFCRPTDVMEYHDIKCNILANYFEDLLFMSLLLIGTGVVHWAYLRFRDRKGVGKASRWITETYNLRYFLMAMDSSCMELLLYSFVSLSFSASAVPVVVSAVVVCYYTAYIAAACLAIKRLFAHKCVDCKCTIKQLTLARQWQAMLIPHDSETKLTAGWAGCCKDLVYAARCLLVAASVVVLRAYAQKIAILAVECMYLSYLIFLSHRVEVMQCINSLSIRLEPDAD